MNATSVLRKPILLLIACAVVGLLAANGNFASMVGFPIVFGMVCFTLGLFSLRHEPRQAFGTRMLLVLLSPALAAAGYFTHQNVVERSRATLQAQLSDELVGSDAFPLTDLVALNVDPDELKQFATYSAPATIVTFWGRRCSPCWTELPELDELYRQHVADGLAIVAVTRYDRPDDKAACQSQLVKDRDYVRSKGFALPFAIAKDSKIYQGFMVRSVPTGALIDGEGRIIAYGVGLEGGRELMRRASELLSGATLRSK